MKADVFELLARHALDMPAEVRALSPALGSSQNQLGEEHALDAWASDRSWSEMNDTKPAPSVVPSRPLAAKEEEFAFDIKRLTFERLPLELPAEVSTLTSLEPSSAIARVTAPSLNVQMDSSEAIPFYEHGTPNDSDGEAASEERTASPVATPSASLAAQEAISPGNATQKPEFAPGIGFIRNHAASGQFDSTVESPGQSAVVQRLAIPEDAAAPVTFSESESSRQIGTKRNSNENVGLAGAPSTQAVLEQNPLAPMAWSQADTVEVLDSEPKGLEPHVGANQPNLAMAVSKPAVNAQNSVRSEIPMSRELGPEPIVAGIQQHVISALAETSSQFDSLTEGKKQSTVAHAISRDPIAETASTQVDSLQVAKKFGIDSREPIAKVESSKAHISAERKGESGATFFPKPATPVVANQGNSTAESPQQSAIVQPRSISQDVIAQTATARIDSVLATQMPAESFEDSMATVAATPQERKGEPAASSQLNSIAVVQPRSISQDPIAATTSVQVDSVMAAGKPANFFQDPIAAGASLPQERERESGIAFVAAAAQPAASSQFNSIAVVQPRSISQDPIAAMASAQVDSVMAAQQPANSFQDPVETVDSMPQERKGEPGDAFIATSAQQAASSQFNSIAGVQPRSISQDPIAAMASAQVDSVMAARQSANSFQDPVATVASMPQERKGEPATFIVRSAPLAASRQLNSMSDVQPQSVSQAHTTQTASALTDPVRATQEPKSEPSVAFIATSAQQAGSSQLNSLAERQEHSAALQARSFLQGTISEAVSAPLKSMMTTQKAAEFFEDPITTVASMTRERKGEPRVAFASTFGETTNPNEADSTTASPTQTNVVQPQAILQQSAFTPNFAQDVPPSRARTQDPLVEAILTRPFVTPQVDSITPTKRQSPIPQVSVSPVASSEVTLLQKPGLLQDSLEEIAAAPLVTSHQLDALDERRSQSVILQNSSPTIASRQSTESQRRKSELKANLTQQQANAIPRGVIQQDLVSAESTSGKYKAWQDAAFIQRTATSQDSFVDVLVGLPANEKQSGIMQPRINSSDHVVAKNSTEAAMHHERQLKPDADFRQTHSSSPPQPGASPQVHSVTTTPTQSAIRQRRAITQDRIAPMHSSEAATPPLDLTVPAMTQRPAVIQETAPILAPNIDSVVVKKPETLHATVAPVPYLHPATSSEISRTVEVRLQAGQNSEPTMPAPQAIEGFPPDMVLNRRRETREAEKHPFAHPNFPNIDTSPSETPPIRIHLGRIRFAPPTAKRAARSVRSKPAMTLDRYLTRRTQP